jgi:hypothetical protein
MLPSIARGITRWTVSGVAGALSALLEKENGADSQALYSHSGQVIRLVIEDHHSQEGAVAAVEVSALHLPPLRLNRNQGHPHLSEESVIVVEGAAWAWTGDHLPLDIKRSLQSVARASCGAAGAHHFS